MLTVFSRTNKIWWINNVNIYFLWNIIITHKLKPTAQTTAHTRNQSELKEYTTYSYKHEYIFSKHNNREYKRDT